ncbi:toxin VasX [Vreelandella titanicae]|uniref:toxin VasX n=1 Tax=Vreelandella titanicae TaxID=664683 RepID=UPI00315A7CCC
MSAFERPSDDRDNAEFAAHELSSRDSEEAATCPLFTGKVRLVPLRYGIVEELEPEKSMPYSLTARPLGIRLLRNGFLYVLDGESNELHEYEYRDQGDTLKGHNGGKLEYETDRTLYVCFSEIQWTGAKRAQVQESEEDRDAFMQAVNLASANPATGGGEHLITTAQAEEWVAEFAEDAELEVPEEGYEHEAEPYLWENDHYYHKTRLGKLLAQHEVEDRDECLCLIARDDIGVMRDLAQFQDEVVGWIEQWATEKEGRTERDYMLACYIESLSQLNEASLDDMRQVSDDPAVQAMLDEIAAMEEPRKSEVRQKLLEFLNQESNTGRLPQSYDPDLPEDLKERLDEIRDDANRTNSRTISDRLDREINRYYLEKSLCDSLGSDFVDRHGEALLSMKQKHNERLKALLKGSKIGERGINDLIDRRRMDDFLAEQRPRLQRWNAMLDAISDDRADMLCNTRFHNAAWYFDPQVDEQVLEGFKAQYGCLKDICRNDEVTERIADWLEGAPYYDRPLFHTLPLADQNDFISQYSTIANAGYGTLLKLDDLRSELTSLEAGQLPAIDTLPDNTQVIADSAHQTLGPAISRGISQVMEEFYQGIDRHSMPDIEELFRRLPKALPARILDAAQRTGATFVVASPEELTNFRRTVQRVLTLREELDIIRKRRNEVKKTAGHRSPEAKDLRKKFENLRHELQTVHEPALAKAISPIEELPENSVRIAGAKPGRVGLTAVFSAAQQAEVGRLIGNVRQGIAAAPRVNLAGDGLGLLVFVAQLSTLAETFRQYQNLRGTDEALTVIDLAKVFATTGSAGFLAAQGIMDTALSTRSKVLANAFNVSGAQSVSASLGRLHVFLGGFTYLFGSFAAYSSLTNRYGTWQEAVRSGNRSAQSAAMASTIGAGGMLGANIYGLVNTLYSGYGVAFRGVEWAAAGARLGTVFWRFNLAGALFTVLELGGSWLYNYYSVSRHDEWLLSTPWSQDASKASNDTLEAYQARLQEIAQAPIVNVTIEEADSWWTRKISGPISVDFKLVLPISLQDLIAPFGGKAPVRLFLGGYQVHPEDGGRDYRPERWVTATDKIVESMSLADKAPLAFALPQPEPLNSISARPTHNVFAVRLEVQGHDGQYQANDYHIYLSPAGGSGDYTPSDVAIRGGEAPWQNIDPLLF